MGCLFTLLKMSFDSEGFKILVNSDLSISSFVVCAFGVRCKQLLLDFPGTIDFQNWKRCC